MADKVGKNPKKLIVILLAAVLALGAVGGGVWWFLLRNKEVGGVTRKIEEETHSLREFTVNLNGQKKSVFIRLKITIGYEKSDDAVAKLDKSKSQIRDSINMLLLTKTEEEVTDAFELEQLKRQIKIRISSIVEGVSITDIYIDDIAVQ